MTHGCGEVRGSLSSFSGPIQTAEATPPKLDSLPGTRATTKTGVRRRSHAMSRPSEGTTDGDAEVLTRSPGWAVVAALYAARQLRLGREHAAVNLWARQARMSWLAQQHGLPPTGLHKLPRKPQRQSRTHPGGEPEKLF